MSIIVTEAGKKPRKVDRQVIDRERHLQEYIWEHPEVLPLDDYKPGVRITTLVREFPTNSGPIDAFAVDQDGEVYLIETKLYKNPDKRLVLAQVLDYGAALWQADVRDILAALESRVSVNRGRALTQMLTDAFELAENETETLVEAIRSNLETGLYRFIVLMDQVDDRLRDLVAYINHNSRFDVFCIALDFYRSHDLEIVIPKLHGAAHKKAAGGKSGSGARRKWDEQAFFEDARARLDATSLKAVRAIYDWAVQRSDGIVWGSGAKVASFNPRFDHVSRRSVFSVYSDGSCEIHFKWLKDNDAPAYARELGQRLRQAGVIEIPNDFMVRHVNCPVQTWAPKRSQLTQVLEAVLFSRSKE